MAEAIISTAKANQRVGRTASKEVRRRQLIEATIESIAQRGISGTTMNTVTSLAGLSLGIVNFHFKNKQTLFEETLRYLAEEHRDQWQKGVRDAALTPEARLLAMVDAEFHPNICSRKKLTVWFAFYGEAAYRASYRRIMTEMDSDRWRNSRALCQQIVDGGDYADADADDIANTLEGLYDGFCLNILIYPGEFTREDAKRRVGDYLATTFPQNFTRPAPPACKG